MARRLEIGHVGGGSADGGEFRPRGSRRLDLGAAEFAGVGIGGVGVVGSGAGGTGGGMGDVGLERG